MFWGGEGREGSGRPCCPSRWLVMLVAQCARLKSKLSARSAVRESRKIEPKLPAGASDVKALPRRRDFANATFPDKEWSQAIDAATENFGRAGRAGSTSYEHDLYMWAFNEYLIRQGFESFVDLVKVGQKMKATSSTGRLAPTYDDDGAMRVVTPQMLLSYILDMAAGSEEAPKGGHPLDRPFAYGDGTTLMPKARAVRDMFVIRGRGNGRAGQRLDGLGNGWASALGPPACGNAWATMRGSRAAVGRAGRWATHASLAVGSC